MVDERETETLMLMGETMNIKTTAMIMVTTAILATGCGDDAAPLPDVTPSPAQQKMAMMENAKQLGEFIVVYDGDQTTRMAMFYGTKRVVFIKPNDTRTVDIPPQMARQLTFRKWVCTVDDDGNDDCNWHTTYTFPPLSHGDYVRYTGSSWRITQYTPQ